MAEMKFTDRSICYGRIEKITMATLQYNEAFGLRYNERIFIFIYFFNFILLVKAQKKGKTLTDGGGETFVQEAGFMITFIQVTISSLSQNI